MKQIWDTEDLASHWSLSFEEIQLLKSKPAVLVHRKFARKPDLSFPFPSHPIPSHPIPSHPIPSHPIGNSFATNSSGQP